MKKWTSVFLILSGLSSFAYAGNELKCNLMLAYGNISDDLEVEVLQRAVHEDLKGEKVATLIDKNNEIKSVVKIVPPFYHIRNFFNKKLIGESGHRLPEYGVSIAYNYDLSGKAYVLQVECVNTKDVWF